MDRKELVKKRFDEVAMEYDERRRRLIPCFDDFYGSAVQWVNVEGKAPRFLDLGAGTGLLSALIRSKYPHAHMTLVDLSENMLSVARERFAGDERVEYIAADYTSYPFEGPFDGIISSLSIHHLPHEQKRALFRTVYGLLKEGGMFVNADQVMGQTEYIDQQYKRLWQQAIRDSGLPNEAVESAIERRSLDLNATAGEQIEWLQEAGFRDADCVYQYHDFAVFAACKS
ncbi:class I SAM-dependent methyltransferase [Paenibacillus sp. P26]|nr:class I SAM-dependent methyltransferase [Paenibacillus sp. P26]